MLDIADYSTIRIPGRIVTRVDGEIQLPGNIASKIYFVII
jgi:hypothetical protein